MSAGEVRYWEPQESEELIGAFDFYEGTHWAVPTQDGMVWLLGPHAEEALRAKRPGEGEQMHGVFSNCGQTLDTQVALSKHVRVVHDGNKS